MRFSHKNAKRSSSSTSGGRAYTTPNSVMPVVTQRTGMAGGEGAGRGHGQVWAPGRRGQLHRRHDHEARPPDQRGRVHGRPAHQRTQLVQHHRSRGERRLCLGLGRGWRQQVGASAGRSGCRLPAVLRRSRRAGLAACWRLCCMGRILSCTPHVVERLEPVPGRQRGLHGSGSRSVLSVRVVGCTARQTWVGAAAGRTAALDPPTLTLA